MNIEYNADVIVVGAGPAGISAAYEIAKKGKKVVLLERAQHPGSKNMYGGAVYTSALKEVFKDDFETIPFERVINSHTWSFLNDTGSFDITYKNNSSTQAYAIKRFDLERWMIDIVKKYLGGILNEEICNAVISNTANTVFVIVNRNNGIVFPSFP